MFKYLRAVIKKILRQFYLKYQNPAKDPHETLLGIKDLNISSILDVGANTGQFAREIIRIFPNAKLYCFEPLPEAFIDLGKWAKKNNVQVETFNIAIGDKMGNVDMYYHTEHSPSSSLLHSTKLTSETYPFTETQKKISVTVETLDNVFKDKYDSICTDVLIELDVQGFEDRVIRGGRKVFSMAKAVILEVCLDSLYEQQAKFSDIVLLLDNYGFNYVGNKEQVYGNDGHVIFLDACFVKRNEMPLTEHKND